MPAMYAVETGQEEQITGVPPLWKGIAAGTEAETSEGYRYEEVFEEVLAEYGQLKGLYCETYSSAVRGWRVRIFPIPPQIRWFHRESVSQGNYADHGV